MTANRLRLCRTLFFTFFRIGLFTFGGGYAMLPLIEDICVQRRRWITREQMLQITVIAESTPGPVAINCATYVGYHQAGLWGAAAATLGVVLPSFGIILAISLCLDRVRQIRAIASAFRGIQAAVALLIARAGLRMWKQLPKKPLPQLLFGAALAGMLLINLFGWRVSTIALLAGAGALSLAAYLAGLRKERDAK